ncbi:MAG: (2Fe-2S) ferredoxin domain-containing protein, partial [Clostridiales bacterium]|nr:(2Fe-2S) ferredoxin domain-containing protein [Clostridiales bacterium]
MSAIYTLNVKTHADLEELRQNFIDANSDFRHTVYVCGGGGCTSSHCADIVNAMKKAMALRGLASEVSMVLTGCIGLCAQG